MAEVQKELAGQEDLLWGEGVVLQTRNSQSVPITKIRGFYPVETLTELQNLDHEKFPKAALVTGGLVKFYKWSGAAYSPLEVSASHAPAPSDPTTIGVRFLGIFDTESELNLASSRPSNAQQAIVLKPVEYYYHAVAGSWQKLAPVASVHPTYLGSFASEAGLTSVTPNEGSLALVSKVFYLFEGGKWLSLANNDLTSLSNKVDNLETEVQGIHTTVARQASELTTLGKTIESTSQALQSNIAQKISGISVEDSTGLSYSDVAAIDFTTATISLDGQKVKVDTNAEFSVSNGRTVDSVSFEARSLEFPGSTLTMRDPSGAKVAVVNLPTGSTLRVSDGVGVANAVSEIHFKGLDLQSAHDGSAVNVEIEFKHFHTIADRDKWTTKYSSIMTFPMICVVDDDGNGFVQTYKLDTENRTWKEYNLQGVVLSDSDGAIPKNIKTVVFGEGFTVEQAGDKEDAALVSFTAKNTGKQLDVVEPYRGKKSEDVGTINILPPLSLNSDTSGIAELDIDSRAYEKQHAASCLLQLDSDLTIHKGKPSKVFTTHEIIPTGEYYSLSHSVGGVNIQDNTGGDTAVTGGELTRVLGSVSLYGKATTAGNVRAWFWYKDPTSPLAGGILEDINGHPMVVQRHYNVGDSFEPLVIAGAVMATGQAPIVMYVSSDADEYIVNPDQTLICIEQFSDGYETSLASIEFQRRLGIELHAQIEPFTHKMLSLKDSIPVSKPETVLQPDGTYDAINNFGINNLTDIKASVVSSSLNIKDNSKPTDFYVDTYIDNVKTRMLKGKTIHYSVLMSNTGGAYNLEVYKWTGAPDRAGKVYDSRSGDNLELNTGFTLVKSKTIPISSSLVDHADSVVVPDDAVNLFIILRPTNVNSLVHLTLTDFLWGAQTPFKGYAETSRINLREQHLWLSESWAEFGLRATDLGVAGVRYTINSAGNPMPVGKLLKGKAPVEVDNSVNQVSGSQDPKMDGAVKFNKAGQAYISKSYNVWNEQGTDNTVTFWDVLIDVDGTESKIPASEKTFTVPANTGAPGVVYTIPDYSIDVEVGDRVAGRAKSNKDDGAYVQSQNINEFLVQTEIDFKELVAGSADDPDLVSAPLDKKLLVDRRVYPFSGNSSQNITISLDIPADVELAHVTVVKASGTTTTSVNSAEFSYNNSAKVLTVHVGSRTVNGKVYLELWG